MTDGFRTTLGMNKQDTEIAIKLQYLIDFMDDNGLLMDGCFTFPDGDSWYSTKKRAMK